jgi:SAM-dependent methyltransferase
MDKAWIINHLVAVHGYRRYLELCTTTTGGLYGAIDQSQLAVCRRLMYRCPDDFEDGRRIDYRSNTLDIGACLSSIAAKDRSFDIALVDSWHEYAPSWRDLQEAFRLIRPGGTLVVHDCLPPRAEVAGPLPIPGEWCGVSYHAYIDFVHDCDDLEFYTVNVDYGCGVIRKAPKRSWRRRRANAVAWLLRGPEPEPLLREWQEAKQLGSDEAFTCLEVNREELLNLISVEAFLEREPAPSC